MRQLRTESKDRGWLRCGRSNQLYAREYASRKAAGALAVPMPQGIALCLCVQDLVRSLSHSRSWCYNFLAIGGSGDWGFGRRGRGRRC